VGFLEERIGRDTLSTIASHGGIVAGGCFRDLLVGIDPKDVDVFVPGDGEWDSLCSRLSETLGEVDFAPSGKRVNVRKFVAGETVLDVIDYSFVSRKEHVVETFDFSANMLWLDPEDLEVKGSSRWSAGEVTAHIRGKKLKVGDNLWYRAGLARSLKRWQRFRGEGYEPEGEDLEKYREYVKTMKGGADASQLR
jgi:hypothetical protein